MYIHNSHSDFIITSFIYFRITFSKMNAKIYMNPTGSVVLSLGRSSIVSSNNLFHDKKGSESTGRSNVTKIDGIIKTYSDVV